jgi:hypothetical protein
MAFFVGKVVEFFVCDICWGIIGEKGKREPFSKPEAKLKRRKK